MENPKKIHITTFGCQQNEADSETLLGIALSRGYVETSLPEEADLILFNTCAVREHAELKALSLTGQIKHLKEKNPSLRVGVCGCMVQQMHRLDDVKQKYPYVDFAFGTNMISRFGEILDAVASSRKRLFYREDYKENPGKICEGLPVKRKFTYKAYVPIMSGCNNFCTYCIVPYVRGRERSREPEAIVREVRGLVEAGTKEITLLGQNVNSYGKDLAAPLSFAALLRKIFEIPGDYVLKFMTSHPKDATAELIDAMASDARCERHFHLPLQSGSDRILHAMNRHYTLDQYERFVTALKEKIPDISLTTDIIVGFPGETEEDFEQTLEAMRFCRFDSTFSFIYSPRVGTPAAKLPDRIPNEVSTARMARLLELQKEISTENNARLVGKTLRALCEGESKTNPDFLSARCDSGKLVHFPRRGEKNPVGEFVNLRIREARAIMLIGEWMQ